ncbi:cytochrome P450 [Stachybotrys elegans]|uniref:Cytochrome P450 monooxygenase ABA1 n=1 Tax=Stachybotrys elegans TaxID=80388 RepID=A0A8K0SAG3_9HYPO|nr:cytochrome P450 [Stachybotrys elegans]
MAILPFLRDKAEYLAYGAASLYLLRSLWSYLRLRRFKGPLAAGFTNLLHSRAMISGRCHEWYAEMNAKYGSLARIAPNVLITDSPEVWAHVNKGPGYQRSAWFYSTLRIEHRRDNVFSMTDNELHDKRRLQMSPGYSGRENLALESSIDDCVQNLLSLIRSKYLSTAGQTKPIDLARKIQFFTLDVISMVGLGKVFGMLTADSDVDDYLKSSEEGLKANRIFMALGIGWIAQSPIIGRLLMPSPGDGSGTGKMMETCFRFVNERAANPTDKRSDMLASFIRNGLQGDELRSEALEQIIAGSDTTAGAIRGTLLYIITNPRVYQILQREIDQAVLDGKAPPAGAGLVSFTQTKQLRYLQAVIREGMRIWTPVPSIFSRDVPSGGDVLNVDGEDIFVPGGTCIGYSGVGMHRRRDVYGDDSDVFRPERWFEQDEAKLERMMQTSDLTFGYGRFKCLGKPVAQIEIGKIIFELLRNFDIALVDPLAPWKTDCVNGLFLISDMWVQITSRTTT